MKYTDIVEEIARTLGLSSSEKEKLQSLFNDAVELSHDYSYRPGDGKGKALILNLARGKALYVCADMDTDADGSPRVREIDPDGQPGTSFEINGSPVNSETIPFYVMPKNFKEKFGISPTLGDTGICIHRSVSSGAIFADQGPESLIGEGSIKLVENLGGNPWNSDKTRIISGIDPGVHYLIFINSKKDGDPADEDGIQLKARKDFLNLLGFSPETQPETQPVLEYPGRAFRKGDTGENVRIIQKRLNKLGYGLVEDGIFGPKTKNAVWAFQTAKEIDTDGIVGPQTWAALFVESPRPIPDPLDMIWKPSPNYTDTPARPLKRIILHYTTSRNFNGGVSWLCDPNARVSSHFVVSREGQIARLVRVSDKAWHCYGNNHDSIGIEICAAPGDKMTSIQGKKLAELVAYLIDEYKLSHQGVTGHRFTPGNETRTDCPGSLFQSYEEIQKWVNDNVLPIIEKPEHPVEHEGYKLLVHTKNVQDDLRLSKEESEKLWEALVVQASNKNEFKHAVNEGEIPRLDNAQCAVTTSSVLEHAGIKADINRFAEEFKKQCREIEDSPLWLTHGVEIQLRRFGWNYFLKKEFVALKGSIGLMVGRYSFAGSSDHSGHIYTILEDKGIGGYDIIADNGGYKHEYIYKTDGFWLPPGILPEKR